MDVVRTLVLDHHSADRLRRPVTKQKMADPARHVHFTDGWQFPHQHSSSTKIYAVARLPNGSRQDVDRINWRVRAGHGTNTIFPAGKSLRLSQLVHMNHGMDPPSLCLRFTMARPKKNCGRAEARRAKVVCEPTSPTNSR
jgi:hypothetical protein